MTVTHLSKEAIDPEFENIFLDPDMLYCGARDIFRCSDEDDNRDGWCTVEFWLREGDEYQLRYSHATLCPDCLAHPDVALAIMGELP